MFQQQKNECSQLQRPDELQSADSELSLDELLADPMMPALWRAHGITEGDVRRVVADAAARLKARSALYCAVPQPDGLCLMAYI